MVLCAFFRIFAIRNPKIKKIMAKVYVFLANGFEDIEALIPIDVLRRGGVDVITVSTTEDIIVESAHGVGIRADQMFTACDFSDADLLMLPGGMPGASNLFEHEGVCQALELQAAAGKKIAAICASPAVVLSQLGLLDGKKATCYPGFEQMLETADYTGALVTVDGIGPAKARALLGAMPLSKIRDASVSELEKIKGISSADAERIREYFSERKKRGSKK